MNADHVRVRQLDIVDDEGVCRATLTTGDGMEHGRIAPFSGLIIRDATGRERGGIGVLDCADGTSRAVTALDHRRLTHEAVGTMVTDDGAVQWMMIDAGGSGDGSALRVLAEVSAQGTPSLSLHDAQGRARVRLTLTEEGAGALEFVRADGTVVERIVPEHDGPNPYTCGE